MKPLVPLLCILLFGGCVKDIAVGTVGGIIDEGFGAFKEEQDLELAGQALPANLKLVDVMLKNSPDDEALLLRASEGYSSYALGFVEDSDPQRARPLYLRGRDYGLRMLNENKELAKALKGSPDDLRAQLSLLDDDMVPAVFWTAFGWGSYINLSLTEPDALIDLPRTEAMMQFVLDRDSSYYYGGAHVFLGTLYGSRGKMLGGNPDLAKQHFEKALEINKGKFLMTYVYYARSVAVQTLNEALFDELLAKVRNESIEVLPEFRLGNAIAKRKAEALVQRKAELF